MSGRREWVIPGLIVTSFRFRRKALRSPLSIGVGRLLNKTSIIAELRVERLHMNARTIIVR